MPTPGSSGKARNPAAINVGVALELPLDPATSLLAVVQGAPPTVTTATGTLAAVNDAVQINSSQCATVSVQWTNGAAYVGTVIAEGSNDAGANWHNLFLADPKDITPPTLGPVQFPLAATGTWIIACGGYTLVRVRNTLLSAPLLTVTLAAVIAPNMRDVMSVAKFNATKPALLDTQVGIPQATARAAHLVVLDELPQAQDDTNRVLWVAQRPLSDVTAGNILTWVDGINVNGQVGKASPGRLYYLFGYCVTARYIQVHNATAAPADGAVPLMSIYVPANSFFDLSTELYGRNLSTGIYVCASSTHATKTLSVTGDTDLHTAVA